MIHAECAGPDVVLIEDDAGFVAGCRHRISVSEGRRLAAEILVAVERAERLESDQRAPG